MHGGTLSICPVFPGCSRVVLPEGVVWATLSGPETVGREDEVLQGGVPDRGM